MIERMLAAGIVGLPPRVAAWCAGSIPDEVLLKELEAATPETTNRGDVVHSEEPDGRPSCKAG